MTRTRIDGTLRSMTRIAGVWLAPLVIAGACTVRPLGDGDGGSTTTAASSSAAPTTTASASTATTAASTTAASTTESESTSVAATTVDTSTGANSGDGCPFICPPDLGPIPRACNPVEQDCPDGQKCVWYVAPGNQLRREAARCIPVTGDRGPFEACNLPTGFGPEISDDCGADSYCLEVYETADHGFCAPFAILKNGWYDCEHLPGTLPAVENGSEFPSACLFYECNPLDPSTCPQAMTCTYYPAWGYGFNHCWFVPPGDLPLGAACDYGECGTDKLCVIAEAVPGCAHDRCCTQWCDLDVPGCDDPAAECQLFFGGFPELGACLVPGWEWG